MIRSIQKNIDKSQGYFPSKGIEEARYAIVEYCKSKKIYNVDIEDVYIGNGVSELILMSMQALLNSDDEKFALEFLRKAKILIVQGKGFNWNKPDHFRIVYLPEKNVLESAITGLERFLKSYTDK